MAVAPALLDAMLSYTRDGGAQQSSTYCVLRHALLRSVGDEGWRRDPSGGVYSRGDDLLVEGNGGGGIVVSDPGWIWGRHALPVVFGRWSLWPGKDGRSPPNGYDVA